MSHPFSSIAIAGTYNTRQARRLPGETSISVQTNAALGVVRATGIDILEVDGILGSEAAAVTHRLGIGPCFTSQAQGKIGSVLEAAALVAAGLCRAVIVTEGRAGVSPAPGTTAPPPTRPMNEFIAPYGVYTAVEFALMARRHMTLYGTTSEQMATVAATIRNNGHINPEAIYYGRGPYTPTDILESRMIADPFHLLDCCLTGEGGTAILVTSHDRAKDLRLPPVYVLGGGQDTFSAPYHHAPSWDLGSRRAEERVGLVGRRAAKLAFEAAGLNPSDVDCCEFYDVFSFEIIRQFEAFGFCGEGEGGDFVMDGKIGPDGTFPVTTDGGTLSYSHTGTGQMLQRAGRGVLQLQRLCTTNQIEDVDVVMCSVGGSGAMFSDVMLLGSQRP